MSQKTAADLLKANPELRRKLRELALLDFDQFLKVLDVDQVQVVICAEYEKDASYQEITATLAKHGVKMTRQAVGLRCKKCDE